MPSRQIDHRVIGREHDLFHFQPEAPGMPFWHPRGWATYSALADHIRQRAKLDGYEEVKTPQLLSNDIWQTSGHRDHFRQHMFGLEGLDLAAKPVSCPGHIQLFGQAIRSYRDLPLRLFELGQCHRRELSGSLSGLMRCQSFTQDDGHVFCAVEHVAGEVARFARGLERVYSAVGFTDVRVRFAGRPANRAGDDQVWDRAEALLRSSALAAGLELDEHAGEGAFYGPKLEFELDDARGRSWQCGTIQLDMTLPVRFDIHYVDASGLPRRPVILHRAICGSLERFLALALERHRGALPPWLAAEQLVVASVGERSIARAAEICERLPSAVRARLDARNESVGRKAADARRLGVPLFAVIGDREVDSGDVALRRFGGWSRSMPLAEALSAIAAECQAAAAAPTSSDIRSAR